ncbi:MAG: hypothetical protein R3F43_32385, partial [bacterium]
ARRGAGSFMVDEVRSLGGLERVWLAAGRIHPPFAIQIVLQPDPMPPASAWEAAWAATCAAHPGLRARLAGRLRRTRWIFDAPAPPVQTAPAWAGEAPVEWLDAPLDPARGAPVALVLAGPSVVLRAHHALTDGRGLWAMAEDLLRALDGRPLAGATGGPDDVAWLHGVEAATPPKLRANGEAPTGPADPGYTTLTWRRRRWPAGPDVTARLLAALGAAAQRPLRVGVPVDLRRYRPEAPSDAHLTGVAPGGGRWRHRRLLPRRAPGRPGGPRSGRPRPGGRRPAGRAVGLMRVIGASGARNALKTGRFRCPPPSAPGPARPGRWRARPAAHGGSPATPACRSSWGWWATPPTRGLRRRPRGPGQPRPPGRAARRHGPRARGRRRLISARSRAPTRARTPVLGGAGVGQPVEVRWPRR